MEKHPHHDPEDREPNTHPEDLEPGEIDLTGATQQDGALRDVIAGALTEADSSGGEVPDWGARAIARVFANTLGIPGELHHFAVNGRIRNRDHLLEELAAVNIGASEERHEWANRLGTYVINVPEDTTSTEEPPGPGDQQPAPEIPIFGTPLEKVSAYLRTVFAEADARGEPISKEDAQAIATLLGGLLPPGSEMDRFGETGDAHPVRLHEECQALKGSRRQDVATWLERFEQYLAAQTDLGRQARAEASDNPQVGQGVREHGDAFRAFLRLPDTDPHSSDLLARFHEFYIGAYDSIEALFDTMTDIRACKAEVDAVAERWGLDDFFVIDQQMVETTARTMWDIVEIGGKFYAFSK